LTRKKTHIEAHIGTFSRQGNLYDLGKIKVSVSIDFYQASSGIESFLDKEGGSNELSDGKGAVPGECRID